MVLISYQKDFYKNKKYNAYVALSRPKTLICTWKTSTQQVCSRFSRRVEDMTKTLLKLMIFGMIIKTHDGGFRHPTLLNLENGRSIWFLTFFFPTQQPNLFFQPQPTQQPNKNQNPPQHTISKNIDIFVFPKTKSQCI